MTFMNGLHVASWVAAAAALSAAIIAAVRYHAMPSPHTLPGLLAHHSWRVRTDERVRGNPSPLTELLGSGSR